MWEASTSSHQPVEALAHELVLVGRQPECAHLDADAGALQSLLGQDLGKLPARVAAFLVVPQADVLDDRGAARLLEIGPPRQQRDRPFVPGQHGALEEDEAARVEAGEVVEALLREQQKRVQPLGGERLARCSDAALELRPLEVQRHGPSLPAGAASLFICRAVRKPAPRVMP